ncbi:MAG: sulfurtransferase [Desulfurella sp.]|uniref:sulfurtransferase n=1 Tax=Desulfurella sp. TaxID=1962857 RepID=UPI0003E0A960|nr:hypothetical protein DESACE_09275 [Desulfurella acetivorans A63]
MKKFWLVCFTLFWFIGSFSNAFAKIGILTPHELASMMKTDQNLVIIDARDHSSYIASHIPKAINISPTGSLFTGFGPNPFAVVDSNPQLQKVLSQKGIRNDSDCVVYTGSSTAFGVKGGNPAFALTSATRIMAVLYYAGVKNVYYLNGGFDKWVDEKLPVQKGDYALKTSHFVIVRNNPFVFANEDFIRWAVKHENEIQFVDSRMYPEYTGQVNDEKFGVSKLGHIKGARNVFVGEYMEKVDNYYVIKPKAQIEQILQKAGIDPNKPMISYCHIGYWGSGLWFIANAILDNKLAWDYNGSLVKASMDKDIPFVKGPNPY